MITLCVVPTAAWSEVPKTNIYPRGLFYNPGLQFFISSSKTLQPKNVKSQMETISSVIYWSVVGTLYDQPFLETLSLKRKRAFRTTLSIHKRIDASRGILDNPLLSYAALIHWFPKMRISPPGKSSPSFLIFSTSTRWQIALTNFLGFGVVVPRTLNTYILNQFWVLIWPFNSKVYHNTL